MPSAAFFRNLGLFIREGFFDPATCERLRSKVCGGRRSKGLVIRDDAQDGVLDENSRKVLNVTVPASIESMVCDSLSNLKPALEAHFGVGLRRFEPPVFLLYGEGAFYRPHIDGSPGVPRNTKDRRVSVVIFLNARSSEPSLDTYGGGELTFYGLIDGPNWGKCPFSLDPTPGLLVAFRSDTLHEVRPVAFGQRFAIVSWYTV